LFPSSKLLLHPTYSHPIYLQIISLWVKTITHGSEWDTSKQKIKKNTRLSSFFIHDQRLRASNMINCLANPTRIREIYLSGTKRGVRKKYFAVEYKFLLRGGFFVRRYVEKRAVIAHYTHKTRGMP
jgi:hypothetical protein